MKIIEIEPGSLAEQCELQVGDDLTAINGFQIHDEIDLQFHTSDDYLEIEFSRDPDTYIVEIEKDPAEPLGIKMEPMRYRSCGNHCVFCFVDQNPKGLRKALYFKDEDFRLSFLYGNYVTLTNLSKRDADRIIQQRLSPIYVSVHSINHTARQRLLGIKKEDRLLEKIRLLAHNQIEIHTQIVLCPGFNDGDVLAETVESLSQFYPHLNSVAIVPVGLTKHRQNLVELQPVTAEISGKVIAWGEERAARFYKQWGHHFLYLAHEFYLQINRPLPPASRYDDFSQFENGVGMSRSLLDEFGQHTADYPKKIPAPREITIATGQLAFPLLNEFVLPTLNQIENLSVNLVPVTNHFYGESVTVSGLLTGQDIFNALSQVKLGDTVYLPENCINFDGLFLDDWTLEMLQDKLDCQCRILGSDFLGIFS